MKVRPRGPLLVLTLAAALLGHAANARQARARDSYQIALLDLETEGVNDHFAGGLSQRLRATLSARPEYALRPTQVSLLQLSMAQNCNLTEASCLTSITRSMQLDGLLFGSVTHDGGAPVAMLRRFDLKAGTVVRTSLVAFSSREVQPREIEAAAERLLNEVLAPAAPVKATPLPAELPAPGRGAVPEGKRPQAPLQQALGATRATTDSGSSVQAVFGWTLIGLAAASGGMAAFSAFEVKHAKDDADYKQYRLAVGEENPRVRNVCDEADDGQRYGLSAADFQNAKDSCKTGATYEILQYVFLGSAVLTGALGTYLLLTSGGSSDERRGRRSDWQLRPNVGRASFGLDAALRF